MPDRRWAYALIVLAVASRAAAVLVLQSHRVPRSTYEHGEIAANLLAGRGFSVHFLGADGPTSQQAPVYPYLVAAAYAVAGVETPQSLLILELFQALLGGVLVGGVLFLAKEVAPGRPRVALLAGTIAALHPTLVYAATHVQVALPAATLLTWTLALAYRAGRTGRDRDAVGLGLVGGLLTLTDPILALAAPGACWAVAMGRGGRRALRPVGLAAAVATLGVAPWIVRNAVVHGEFVFIKSTFGYAFWQGNCALSQGTDKVARPSVDRVLAERDEGLQGLNLALWKARHEAGYLDDIALTRSDYQRLARLSEPERSRLLFRRALADLAAEPGRYARLCLRRLRYFVAFDETNPKTRNVVYRVGHLGLTVLAVLGWFLMRPELRRRLGPTVLVVLLITTFHALTIVSARFHIPLEPLLALWAGAAASRWERRRSAALADSVVNVGVQGEGLVGREAVALAVAAEEGQGEDRTAEHAGHADEAGGRPDGAVIIGRLDMIPEDHVGDLLARTAMGAGLHESRHQADDQGRDRHDGPDRDADDGRPGVVTGQGHAQFQRLHPLAMFQLALPRGVGEHEGNRNDAHRRRDGERQERR